MRQTFASCPSGVPQTKTKHFFKASPFFIYWSSFLRRDSRFYQAFNTFSLFSTSSFANVCVSISQLQIEQQLPSFFTFHPLSRLGGTFRRREMGSEYVPVERDGLIWWLFKSKLMARMLMASYWWLFVDKRCTERWIWSKDENGCLSPPYVGAPQIFTPWLMEEFHLMHLLGPAKIREFGLSGSLVLVILWEYAGRWWSFRLEVFLIECWK